MAAAATPVPPRPEMAATPTTTTVTTTEVRGGAGPAPARSGINGAFPQPDRAMTRKTILNDSHPALGARMVDFGGWDMPIHYGSRIDDHHPDRRHVGSLDVSHLTLVHLHGVHT